MRMRTAGPGNLLPEAAYSFRLRLSAPIHTGVVTHLFDVNVISLRVTEAAERLAQELAMIGTLFIYTMQPIRIGWTFPGCQSIHMESESVKTRKHFIAL